MGIVVKRIGFGALVLAAVLLPLRKEAVVNTTQAAVARVRRVDSLEMLRYQAHYRWTAFALRDSAMAMLAVGQASTDRPSISFRGFAGAPKNGEADTIVAALWQRIGPTNPNVRSAVLIYNIHAYDRPAYQGALITENGGHTECVAVTPSDADGDGRPRLWHHDLSQALAPCTLLAAFGAPGAGVATWLAATRFNAARSNGWLAREPFPSRQGPWVPWLDVDLRRIWDNDLLMWMVRTGTLDVALLMRPPYAFGASGLRCIVGDQGSCVTSVLHPATAWPSATEIPADLTLSAEQASPDSITVGTVRPPQYNMVAALIADYGRARFQKFWSSAQPFEIAFHEAFGETLGAWTARWAKREWLASFEAQYRSPNIVLGVTLQPSWLLLVAGWTALALALAASVARRRTA